MTIYHAYLEVHRLGLEGVAGERSGCTPTQLEDRRRERLWRLGQCLPLFLNKKILKKAYLRNYNPTSKMFLFANKIFACTTLNYVSAKAFTPYLY